MQNNITRSDLDQMILYLNQHDPQLTHGPKVEEFESAWSEWLGTKYSVMVNSGASANDLTMIAIRELFGPGEIVVPGLTWVSDVASVINAGHRPVFVDVSFNTLAMETKEVFKVLSDKTKAVFLTHILGFNGLTSELIEELDRRKIPLIEDACESHGATYNGKKVGSFGLASNFSFYYAHHLTTIEGGMICTDNYEIYNLLRVLRSHGLVRESKSVKYKRKFIKKYPDLNSEFIFAAPSHNMRPTELSGVLGISQLSRLENSISKRRKNFFLFLELLDPKVFRLDFNIEGSSNYAFTLILNEDNFSLRNKVEKRLTACGIEFRRGLSGGGNQLRQPYLQRIDGIPEPESLPNTDFIHHFSWYVGNYPDLNPRIFLDLKKALYNL